MFKRFALEFNFVSNLQFPIINLMSDWNLLGKFKNSKINFTNTNTLSRKLPDVSTKWF